MNTTPDNNTNIPAGNNKRSSPLLKVLPIAVLAAVLDRKSVGRERVF